jgi:hypothetical protein
MRVDICKIWFYICREVRDPQLGIIDSNYHCSSIMETRSPVLHRSIRNGNVERIRKNLIRITLI